MHDFQIMADYYHKMDEENRKIMHLIDLTNLNPAATYSDIRVLCQNAIACHTAGICVNPSMVAYAYQTLRDVARETGSVPVRLVSVAGGFPLSQTALDIKLAEVQYVLDHGADEVDVVLNLAQFMMGNYDSCEAEIKACKQLVSARQKQLKVILETALLSKTQIQDAANLAIRAGADFLKTSTGFAQAGASLEAVEILAEVVKQHFSTTGEWIGIKPSAGIRTGAQARSYMLLIEELLGPPYLTSSLFRFGSHSLLHDLTRH